jgi:hypothetical protein
MGMMAAVGKAQNGKMLAEKAGLADRAVLV